MIPPYRPGRFPFTLLLFACTMLGLTHCSSSPTPMSQAQLTDLATRYAGAWSSQSPDSLASFYADTGSLTVNGGEPSVGRAAIRDKARAFMTAFPDMQVRMDSVTGRVPRAVFYWTWTGTNTGPGGTGRAVHIRGYEEWTVTSDGFIADSRGHYDETEYRRQVSDTSR